MSTSFASGEVCRYKVKGDIGTGYRELGERPGSVVVMFMCGSEGAGEVAGCAIEEEKLDDVDGESVFDSNTGDFVEERGSSVTGDSVGLAGTIMIDFLLGCMEGL